MIKAADLALKKKEEQIKAQQDVIELEKQLAKKAALELQQEKDKAAEIQHDPLVTIPVGVAIGLGITTPAVLAAIPVIVIVKLLSKK